MNSQDTILTPTLQTRPPRPAFSPACSRLNNIVIVSAVQELQQAWELVYHQYSSINLIDQNQYKVWAFPHYFEDHAATWVGIVERQITSTISCVLDKERRLPLDEYYSMELDTLRERGANLAEIGLLAEKVETYNPKVLIGLQRHALGFGLKHAHTEFVIGVHPKHARYYNTLFGFEPIGVEKQYTHLNDAPVVLLYLSLKDAKAIRLGQNRLVYQLLGEMDLSRQDNTSVPMKRNKFFQAFSNYYEQYTQQKDISRSA